MRFSISAKANRDGVWLQLEAEGEYQRRVGALLTTAEALRLAEDLRDAAQKFLARQRMKTQGKCRRPVSHRAAEPSLRCRRRRTGVGAASATGRRCQRRSATALSRNGAGRCKL